jgi:hypothetical protein
MCGNIIIVLVLTCQLATATLFFFLTMRSFHLSVWLRFFLVTNSFNKFTVELERDDSVLSGGEDGETTNASARSPTTTTTGGGGVGVSGSSPASQSRASPAGPLDEEQANALRK